VDYFVYILRCADQSLYIGHAEDVDRRVERHNRGEGAVFTRARRPVVVAYSERCGGLPAAVAREGQLKRWTRAKKEALIAGWVKANHVMG
jgi:putative endonuclease